MCAATMVRFCQKPGVSMYRTYISHAVTALKWKYGHRPQMLTLQHRAGKKKRLNFQRSGSTQATLWILSQCASSETNSC